MRTHRRLLMSLLAAALTVLAVAAGTALAGGTGRLQRDSVKALTGSTRGRQHTGGHNRNGRTRRQGNMGRNAGDNRSLPTQTINQVLGADGTWSNGVLSYSIDRQDINNVTLNGTPIKPSFQLDGSIDFQPLGHGRAFMNGDFPFKPSELNSAISALVANHVTFQAEHQHMYDFSPMVWFMHFRARGNAVRIAHEMRNVINTTSTPLPQTSPPNPPTPFDVSRLKSILHGYDAQVSSDGVVTVFVARRNPIYIDGVKVNPATNIATNVSFEPLNSSGTHAAVVPDYGMQANEINNVMAVERSKGWDVGCLYNQETDEHPQLYFSHQFKTGNPYQLAQEVRAGLDHTNSQ